SVVVPMRKTISITSFLRRNQLVGGVASVVRSLTSGMSHLVSHDPRFKELGIRVHHGRIDPASRYASIHYDRHPFRMHFGRFVAESVYGLCDSAGADATLFTNY